MRNLIFNVVVCSLIVGLMLINIYMSYPNRYTFNTDSFLCVEGEVTDTVQVEEPPLFLDTMYNDHFVQI